MRCLRRLSDFSLVYPLRQKPAPPSMQPSSQAARAAVSSPHRFRPSSWPSHPPPPRKHVILPGLASSLAIFPPRPPAAALSFLCTPRGLGLSLGGVDHALCAQSCPQPGSELLARNRMLSKGLRIRIGNKSMWKGLVTLTGEFGAPRDHWAAPSHSAWVTLCCFCPALQPKGVLENFRFVERGEKKRQKASTMWKDL